MHLENILLHAINSIILFFFLKYILSKIYKKNDRKDWIAFAGSIFFAVHPITTESVNWISGRTDILAATFVISSVYFIVIYLDCFEKKYLVLSGTMFLGGMFTKEVSVALLPGIICMISCRDGYIFKKIKLRSKLSYLFGGVSFGTLIILFFVLLRLIAYQKNSSAIGLTVKIILGDLYHSFFICMGTLGFYVKKMIWPFPLNIAIFEVDPLYEIFGVIVFLFCIYLLFKRTSAGAFFLVGMFLITPSFLLAFNQIAWTPYAERYVYLPMMFIVVAVIIWAFRTSVCFSRYLSVPILMVVILAFAGSSFARSRVWMTNLTLWEDTVNKSPVCADAWNDYGIALHKDGQLGKAIEMFKKAGSIRALGYQESYDLNLADVYIDKGEFAEAKRVYSIMVKKSKGRPKYAFNAWEELLQRQLVHAVEPSEIEALKGELRDLRSIKNQDKEQAGK